MPLAKGDVAFECAPPHSAHPAGRRHGAGLEVSFEPTKIAIRDVVMVMSETGASTRARWWAVRRAQAAGRIVQKRRQL